MAHSHIVMEFMGGGEIKWQDSSRQIPVLTVDQVRRICRDVVLGLEYCMLLPFLICKY